MELRLAFGTASSPALFDWPNWVLTRTTMLRTGIPAQWVQKQLDDLCVVTPPSKRDLMEKFVTTHRATCARVGVKLAPETDKEKAFSSQTSGTILGVQYNTITWSWNIDCEKVKVILHMLYDIVEAKSVTNGDAMTLCGKIVHYAPLFAGAKWWRKPLTNLPDNDASKRKLLSISNIVRLTLRYWIMQFNRLRLGDLPIIDPIQMSPSWFLPIFTDASGVHDSNNALKRGAGVMVDNTLVRFVWPGNSTWISNHGRSTTLLESIAALQGLLTAVIIHGRRTYTIFCDNAGTCHSFRKGSCKCLYTWTVLKALDDLASGTMSIVTIAKTRRCSGFGENVADAIAKGDMFSLSKMGLQNATWSRPSRVLMDWVKKPVVTPNLGKMLLDELSAFMDVIVPASCTA